MINAVLVFNNSGQPRLTKFYTQLVYLPFLTLPFQGRVIYIADYLLQLVGHIRPTTPHFRDLHPRLQPPRLRL